MSVKAENNQNIINICVQEFGGAASLFQFALQNNISPSQLLRQGQILQKDEDLITDKDVVMEFEDLNFIVVTGSETIPDFTGDFGKEFNEDFGESFKIEDND